MGKDLFWTFVTFGIVFGILFLAIGPEDTRHVTVKYDCRIAEVSTDYPATVKEQCRKLRSQK